MNNVKKDERLGFLGLLYVAHKVVIGEELIENFSKVSLLIMAKDATSNQSASLKRKAERNHLPLIEDFSKAEMGQALGHEEITFLGIIDKKAAGAYLKKSTGGTR